MGKNIIMNIQLRKLTLKEVAPSGYAHNIFSTMGAKHIQAVEFNIYAIDKIQSITNRYFLY